ncbi:MAG: zinc ribbon domain-containing protein [Thermodesulfobacteriota bacterium]
MEETTKGQIGTLIKLQEAESEIVRLESVLKQVEKEQNRVSSKLKEFEKALNELEESYNLIESACSECESEIEVLDQRIKTSNEHLRQVKTNKEYQAVKREIDDNSKRKEELENNLLRYFSEKEDKEQALADKRKEYEQLVEQIKAENEDIEKRSADDRELLEECRKKSRQMGEEIDPDIFDKFKKISRLNNGLAVVPVRSQACMGCFLNIPPQLFIEVQRGNSLIMCPQCNRFLYFEHEE